MVISASVSPPTSGAEDVHEIAGLDDSPHRSGHGTGIIRWNEESGLAVDD